MPAARKALTEAGVPATQVTATGPGGRLLKEDVKRHLADKTATVSAPPTPVVTPQALNGDRSERVEPMSPIRRRIAERLVESQQTAALLTTFNEIDMSGVDALRKQHQDAFVKRYGVKLGFMSFFVKAAVDALKLVPQVNGEIRDKAIVYKNYYDIGIAVGGGKGLVVPVLRDAEHLSFAEIEQGIKDFARRAEEGTLSLEEIKGGTFTITNGGVYGSLLVDADRQPAAERHPRPARHPGPPGGDRRPDRHPADDVRGADLRPPHRRRPRGRPPS